MVWDAIYNRIGKQPLSWTRSTHAYALLENEKGEMQKIHLCLKYDAKGRPYFIKDTAAQDRYEQMQRNRFNTAQP